LGEWLFGLGLLSTFPLQFGLQATAQAVPNFNLAQHPSPQHLRAEGFRDVIVRPRLEAVHLLPRLGPCREHEDRNVTG